MDIAVTDKNTKHLEEIIDQLTDEYQFYFLGVLEALSFAQNAKEIALRSFEHENK
jgi:hypothetical protein